MKNTLSWLARSPEPGRQPETHIYLRDLRTDVTSRITQGDRQDQDPVWSPDSHRIVYSDAGLTITGDRSPSRLMELTIGERMPKTILEEKADFVSPDDWSRDGRFLLFRRYNQAILTLPMEGWEKPTFRLDLGAKLHLDEAHLSPDGRWIAYPVLHGK